MAIGARTRRFQRLDRPFVCLAFDVVFRFTGFFFVAAGFLFGAFAISFADPFLFGAGPVAVAARTFPPAAGGAGTG